MDSSFREQEYDTQKASTGFRAGRRILASLINWLASLLRLTEEEREDAGIYLDHPRGE
jgi:hypothetical protein